LADFRKALDEHRAALDGRQRTGEITLCEHLFRHGLSNVAAARQFLAWLLMLISMAGIVISQLAG
jgi:hypothetical protein